MKLFIYPYFSLQLCATKSGRLYVKDKNTYVIMRELHRWEKDREASMVVMKLIDLLIGDEPGQGMDSNLKNVDVPEKYVEQFVKNDEEMLKDDSSDEESWNLLFDLNIWHSKKFVKEYIIVC